MIMMTMKAMVMMMMMMMMMMMIRYKKQFLGLKIDCKQKSRSWININKSLNLLGQDECERQYLTQRKESTHDGALDSKMIGKL
jgi:hypothetical protein